MRRPHKLSATAAVASAAAAALGAMFLLNSIAPDSKPISIAANDIYTWDCEYPEYKPKSITLTCADGGISIDYIAWTTWSAEGAKGTGTWRQNLCEPNCAEGKIVRASVNLEISNLSVLKGRYYLRTLDIITKDGKDFPSGRADRYQWDVMEFAEMVDWDSK